MFYTIIENITRYEKGTCNEWDIHCVQGLRKKFSKESRKGS